MSISILNEVLGPIMHGPSSSHTAASYNIGRLTLMLCGDSIKEISIIFDSKGSFARTYKAQNGDIALLAGVMNIPIDDICFLDSVNLAKKRGISYHFIIKDIPEADHPNYMIINIPPKGLTIVAKSIGGGMILVEKINQWSVEIKGNNYNLFIEYYTKGHENIIEIINKYLKNAKITRQESSNYSFLSIKSPKKIEKELIRQLNTVKSIIKIIITQPIVYPIHCTPLFKTTIELLNLSVESKYTLGKMGLRYESKLLNLDETTILKEMQKRVNIMFSSIEKGLEESNSSMKLLKHSASSIKQKENILFSSGVNLRSAYRAMAAMDTASSGGLICAAPTGASCGVVSSVLYTLHYDLKIPMNKIVECAFAAGVIGVINGIHSTFAAEIAGCQVEIGMAGAMAAAAVVEAADGTPNAATSAASIALQNTMGSVCDLVAGYCEIPCHTRNAVAASNAFICADIILGGYLNPINLDDSIKASYESGMMLPPELRCTSLGGIAITESAKKIEKVNKIVK